MPSTNAPSSHPRHPSASSTHGHGIGGHCLVCQRIFDVSLPALINERGGDSRYIGMKQLTCPGCLTARPRAAVKPAETFFLRELCFTEGKRTVFVDAEVCRAKACELREKARTKHDPSAHAHLLMMANQYDWLAGWIEAQAQQRTPEQT